MSDVIENTTPINPQFAAGYKAAVARATGEATQAPEKPNSAQGGDSGGAASTSGDGKTGGDSQSGSSQNTGDKPATQQDTASEGKQPTGEPLAIDWNRVTPALKKLHDAADAEGKAALEAQVRTTLERTRELKQLKTQAAPPRPTVHRPATVTTGTAKERGDKLKTLLTGKAMTDLTKEAPEIADAIREVASGVIEEVSNLATDQEATNKVFADMSAAEQAAHFDRQDQTLADVHPDWMTVCDDKFDKWLDSEAPAPIKDMALKNSKRTKEYPNGRIIDGVEAATVISFYKMAKGMTAEANKPSSTGNSAEGSQQQSPVDQKRQRQQDSAVDPNLKGPGAASGIDKNDYAAAYRAASARAEKELAERPL